MTQRKLINKYYKVGGIMFLKKSHHPSNGVNVKGVKMAGPILPKAGQAPETCVVGGVHALILKLSSYTGLAPLKFEPLASGWTVSLSTPMCYYSFILVTVLIALTTWGLIDEIMIGTDKSVRMTSRMSQVVSAADILVVVLTAGSGVYGAPARMRSLIRIMHSVATVDSNLGIEYSMLTERNSCLAVGLLMISFTALLVDDFTLYINLAKKNNRHWEVTINYIGFYLLYYIVVILELQFAFTASAVRKRFKAVNDALGHATNHIKNAEKDKKRSPINMYAIRVTPEGSNGDATKNVGILVDSLTLFPDPALIIRKTSGSVHLTVPVGEAVRRLSELHGSLCSVIWEVDRGYGLPLLMILISTLLQLIVTPYFLILDLISWTSQRIHFLALQFLWSFAHCMRLIVVVEPCHHTVVEGRRSQTMVSELIGAAPTKGPLQDSLEIFARQLFLRTFTFSPMGICTLDRPLIATVLGAVTTYLVILIQFQKSDMV